MALCIRAPQALAPGRRRAHCSEWARTLTEPRQSLVHTSKVSKAQVVCGQVRPARTLCVLSVAYKQGEVEQDADAMALRNMVSSQFQYSVKRRGPRSTGNPLVDLVEKIRLAYRIFFPPAEKELTPKEEVKKRLRMVLVADRCGMSPASLAEMKKTIVRALQDFVDIEGEDGIEVSITSEPGVGTVYSVNIPVRRVKVDGRFEPVEGTLVAPDGVTIEWDPSDYNSDPSSRFPMGC